jgi:hypothetical protein
MTRRAFIALERPVGMVGRMLGHPFSNANLALDHAALKGDVALVAVGNDFFDTSPGTSRQNMTENGHKRHEHPTFQSPAVATGKTDASRAAMVTPSAAAPLSVVRLGSHPELRVSPMNAIERKFSLARCRFTLDDRARGTAASVELNER